MSKLQNGASCARFFFALHFKRLALIDKAEAAENSNVIWLVIRLHESEVGQKQGAESICSLSQTVWEIPGEEAPVVHGTSYALTYDAGRTSGVVGVLSREWQI